MAYVIEDFAPSGRSIIAHSSVRSGRDADELREAVKVFVAELLRIDPSKISDGVFPGASRVEGAKPKHQIDLHGITKNRLTQYVEIASAKCRRAVQRASRCGRSGSRCVAASGSRSCPKWEAFVS